MKNFSRRLVLQAAAGAAALAVMKLQAAEGLVTRAFEVLDLDWADSARQRPVPVRLYLPDTAPVRTGRVPLVVFSHGIGGSRRGYSYLGQHFARNGVASLHLQHVGSDRTLWGGGVFSLVGRLQAAAQESEAIARVHDLRFALDTLLAGELAPRFDDSRIVAAGHSYGANTTLLAAGARVARDGREIVLKDERVRAAIAISAPPLLRRERTASASCRASPCPACTSRPPTTSSAFLATSAVPKTASALFDAMGGERKWLAVFEGGSHSMFTDRAGTGGVALNPQVKAATQALTLAFVRTVFDGDAAALAAWPQQHAGILARFSGPA